MIALLSISHLYNTQDLSSNTYFNSILLFTFPLLLEYKFGFKCYTKLTNGIRWIGYVFTFIICVICFLGIFSLAKISLNQNEHVIEGISVLNIEMGIIYFIMRYTHVIVFILVFFDWFLGFRNAEIAYYNLTDAIDQAIRDELLNNNKNILNLNIKKIEDEFRHEISDQN